MKVLKPTLAMTMMLILIMAPNILASDFDKNRKKNVKKQTAGLDVKLLDINQIECYFRNDGKFAENPQTGGDGFYYPSGQRTLSCIYTAGLWVLGNVGGEKGSAVAMFDTEYEGGALLSGGIPDYTNLTDYIIYKYNSGDNVKQVAIDQGCPGTVMGDQMLFCVYNDAFHYSRVWHSNYCKSLLIEVQQTAFAFNSDSALDNTLFIKYRIINEGQDDIDSAFISVFFDPDIGISGDDATGCDTTRNLVYAYNGDDWDDLYGPEVPAIGCRILRGPVVDQPGESVILPDGSVLYNKRMLGMTSSYFFINSSIDPGTAQPDSIPEAFNYVSGYQRTGSPWIDPSANNTETKYPLAGDPVNDTGWLFKHISNPTDIRMGSASGPFHFAAGDTQDVIVAVIAATGTDNLNSVTLMKSFSDEIEVFYQSNFGMGPTGIGQEQVIPSTFTLHQNHPNPFNPATQITYTLIHPDHVTLTLYDLTGRNVQTLVNDFQSSGIHSIHFHAGHLSSGVYFYQLKVGNDFIDTKKMVLTQ